MSDQRLSDGMPEAAKHCLVCKEPCVDNAPRDDRWSWGPDGAHCHVRCEATFWEALKARDSSPRHGEEKT